MPPTPHRKKTHVFFTICKVPLRDGRHLAPDFNVLDGGEEPHFQGVEIRSEVCRLSHFFLRMNTVHVRILTSVHDIHTTDGFNF